MGLHLDNEIFCPVPFDHQGFIERRQIGSFEAISTTAPRTARTFPFERGAGALEVQFT
jgi:hypothetical protein